MLRLLDARGSDAVVDIEEVGRRFERLPVGARSASAGAAACRPPAAVRAAVDLAEARSVCVCEECGARGRLYRADDVLAVRCTDHAEGVPAVRPELENVHLTQVTVKGRLRVVVAARYDYDTDAFVRIEDVGPLSRGGVT
ncbi:MAG: hypothetical protein AB1586_31770 [Pseudomonadota bacterium]